MNDWLWWTGVALVNGAVLPQLWRTIRTRRVRDLALGREAMLLSAFLLFQAWYMMNNVYPPAITNLVSITSGVTMFSLVAYHKWRDYRHARECTMRDFDWEGMV